MATHSYTFTHDKGVVLFTDTTADRTYSLDINSGIFRNAKTQNAIKGMPAGFGRFLDHYAGEDCVLLLLRSVRQGIDYFDLHTNGYTLTTVDGLPKIAGVLNLMDRVQSLGASIGNDRYSYLRPDELAFLDKHFKAFAEYCRQTEHPTITDFMRGYARQLWFESNHLSTDHLSPDEQEYIYRNRECFTTEQLPYVAYYIARGISEVLGCYESIQKIHRFFDYCEKIGVEPRKEDFFRQYINVKRTYDKRKAEFDAAALIRHYNKKRDALTFENGDYTVVIPSTRDDFEREGNAQSNCVFSMYLDRVIAGDTYVVFIRRKDAPNDSLITCEVNLSGRIRQYLEKYNHYPTDADLLDFQRIYAQHLAENWGR